MTTVLIVDDEPIICDVLRQVLAPRYPVLTATSSREGLALFQQHRPQITLLDLHMPEMGGIAVLQEIRKIDPAASVIVLSGSAPEVLEIQARELGVTDFLLKGTLSFDALLRTVGRAAQQAARTSSTQRQGGDSILVVDDQRGIREVLAQFLTGRGYGVRTAPDGPEALALAKQAPPGLVILDLYLPGMNGVEVFRQLRAQHYGGSVIALTGSQDEALLQEMLELGAVDILGKPVDLERVALLVQVGLVLTGR